METLFVKHDRLIAKTSLDIVREMMSKVVVHDEVFINAYFRRICNPPAVSIRICNP